MHGSVNVRVSVEEHGPLEGQRGPRQMVHRDGLSGTISQLSPRFSFCSTSLGSTSNDAIGGGVGASIIDSCKVTLRMEPGSQEGGRGM